MTGRQSRATGVVCKGKIRLNLQLKEEISWFWKLLKDYLLLGFPSGSIGKEFACNAGDLVLIPGSARSPGEGNGNPLQYSCLENSMGRGAWLAWLAWPTVGRDCATNLKGFIFIPIKTARASSVPRS